MLGGGAHSTGLLLNCGTASIMRRALPASGSQFQCSITLSSLRDGVGADQPQICNTWTCFGTTSQTSKQKPAKGCTPTVGVEFKAHMRHICSAEVVWNLRCNFGAVTPQAKCGLPAVTSHSLEVIVCEAQHPLSHIQANQQVTQQSNHVAHVAEPGQQRQATHMHTQKSAAPFSQATQSPETACLWKDGPGLLPAQASAARLPKHST